MVCYGCDVRILHQDAYVLAIDKPAGLLTVPGRAPDAPALSAQVREIVPEAIPVHRLDGDTSGIVLSAAPRAGPRALTAAFARRRAGDLWSGAPDPDEVVLARTPLQAAGLRIPHPRGRGWLWVESPLPDDIGRCLALLRASRRYSVP